MYHGEVNVAQEELNSFLAVVEDLQVKGLTQNHFDESIQHYKVNTSSTAQVTKKELLKHQTLATVSQPVHQKQQWDDVEVVSPCVKNEPEDLYRASALVIPEGYQYGGSVQEEQQQQYDEHCHGGAEQEKGI